MFQVRHLPKGMPCFQYHPNRQHSLLGKELHPLPGLLSLVSPPSYPYRRPAVRPPPVSPSPDRHKGYPSHIALRDILPVSRRGYAPMSRRGVFHESASQGIRIPCMASKKGSLFGSQDRVQCIMKLPLVHGRHKKM